jgi:hypothetical protein
MQATVPRVVVPLFFPASHGTQNMRDKSLISPGAQALHLVDPGIAISSESHAWHCELFVCATAVENLPASHFPRHLAALMRPALSEKRPAAHAVHCASEERPSWLAACLPALHSPLHPVALLPAPSTVPSFPAGQRIHWAFAVSPGVLLHRPFSHDPGHAALLWPVLLPNLPASQRPSQGPKSALNDPEAHGTHADCPVRPLVP